MKNLALSGIYDVTSDYKGFTQKPYSDNNRFKGYRVHLYINEQGKYGFVERGKDCQNTYEGFELQLRFTFEHAVDCLLDQNNPRNYTCYKFPNEYIQGYYMGLGDGLLKFQPNQVISKDDRIKEIKDFNSKILQSELKIQRLKESLNTAKKALTESKELLRDMNRECDGLSQPEETLYNIISQSLTAIGDEKVTSCSKKHFEGNRNE